ncbi:hypothetical protein F0U60_01925 [Archangium minus]|uniref:Lipoprotein n=1 Tax=Archangium minus TaxID=83450 RepID=A0ABY9WI72_9BACT|nr:hypothetical protein F0U60_01925 [Archangium minus]
MTAHVVLSLCVLLVALPARAGPYDLPALEVVRVREHLEPVHGRALLLGFKRLPPELALAQLTVEDARAFVAELEAAFEAPRAGPRHLARLSRCGLSPILSPCPPGKSRASELERRLRASHEEIFGAASLPLPDSLEDSRWFQALKLSPRYMGEGVREAAMELLGSPTVAYSVALSMMLYMMAWAAPEPVFSKALAAAVTLGLMLTYTAAELYAVGMACLTLYREAEAARTKAQLEAVAERFGKALGGVGLRVLVTVAGAKLARGLPEVPKGGMWARLSPPRFVLAGGVKVGAKARAQVSVANGTVVLMGVSAGTTGAAVASASTLARTTGACRDASDKGDAKGHHIATDKNDVSDASGGPWTPRFKDLFDRAGMSLDDPANIVHLIGHVGPHPEEYHQKVYERLQLALGQCGTKAECRSRLTAELDQLAADICKPGSRLNKLATRKP